MAEAFVNSRFPFVLTLVLFILGGFADFVEAESGHLPEEEGITLDSKFFDT